MTRGPAETPNGVGYVIGHFWWVWLAVWLVILLALMFSRRMSD